MTQAYNLTLFANNADTSGKVSNSALTGLLPIANGGTNNASLGVTAGGIVYTDGSKLANIGAGTTGQAIISNAASAPAWGLFSTPSLVALSSTSFSAVTSTTVSGLTLTDYKFLSIIGQMTNTASTTFSIGSASTLTLPTIILYSLNINIDLNNQAGVAAVYRGASGTLVNVGVFQNLTGITTATTSITFSVSAGTMTGAWQIWGMK